MNNPTNCFICNNPLDNNTRVSAVKQKGIIGLIARSKLKDDDKWKCLEGLVETKVHEKCRVTYNLTNKKVTDEGQSAAPQPVPAEPPFSFENDCVLCHKPWKPLNKPCRKICTPKAQECIIKSIAARNDDWSEKVRRKIEGKDLLTEKARYHIECYEKFRYKTKDNLDPKQRLPGLDAAFEGLCHYMEESGECQFTYNSLLEKMEGWTTTKTTLKQRLIAKYGSELVFVERPPKPTVICFRNTGINILAKFYDEGMAKDPIEDKKRLVCAVGAIIREDVRSQVYETSSYPPPEELLQNVEADIPETLLLLLDSIYFKNSKNRDPKIILKRNALAHAIIAALRPRSFISSILLAVGVYFERKFGSRILVDVLNKLGFCESYANLNLYEASAIMSYDKKMRDDELLFNFHSTLSQHIDNVSTGKDDDDEFFPFIVYDENPDDEAEDESGPSTSKKRRMNESKDPELCE
ncbi:uncharacterized protein LOC107042751 isoform X2 [Diachasma alloeum]|uniref:uncharacterized protein LOC107042751 isoform X2 n=1 Tax=Diachasma alloeum TaxID=454923 RepID=UPI0007383F64|nr:uncharacterized protein LOC107042751 isoform X2 [Diachasma alloeum]